MSHGSEASQLGHITQDRQLVRIAGQQQPVRATLQQANGGLHLRHGQPSLSCLAVALGGDLVHVAHAGLRQALLQPISRPNFEQDQ